jgi:hypothetical protein
MSLELIENQIREFLKTETPEILAIKGAWGVGKTFLWNRNLLKAKDHEIALKKYSYVSLFGINSIDDLKLSIFTQVGNRKYIGSDQVSTAVRDIERIASSLGRKGIPLLKGLPHSKDFWPVIQALLLSTLKKTLICMDDFERMGQNLRAQDVMGLANLLKEQAQCKIVLIFNEEELDESATRDYRKFREKVVDAELVFEPTPSECTQIALGNDPISLGLKGFIEALGINNIRIINKIERLARIVCSRLAGFDDGVMEKALHSLTLFAWSVFGGTDSVPDLEFIKRADHYMLSAFSGKEKKDSEEDQKDREWTALLNRYRFYSCCEFDLQIASMVERGYVNDESFMAEATKLNEQVKSAKSRSSLDEAWRILDESFDDNESEVVNKFHNYFKDNVKYLRPTDLDGVVTILRFLGQEELADNLIQDYIKTRSDEPQLFALRKSPLWGHFRDKKLTEAFDKVDESQRDLRTVKDVLEEIADTDGWNPDDERVLSSATPEEYYQLFKNERGPQLALYIDKCLRFGRNDDFSPQLEKIAANATDALKRIATENRLNRLRVKRCGIELETTIVEKDS